MTASAPTTAQLDANRANAQHSTGPKTGAGKAASSQNSRTHGFAARSFCIAEDEKETFSLFLAALRRQIKPVGALEDYHFQVVVQTAWNLQRLRHHESEILAVYGNPFLEEQLGKALGRLARYKRGLERSYAEAFNALRDLQTNRAQNEPEQDPDPASPPTNRLQLMAKRTQSTAVPNEPNPDRPGGADLRPAGDVQIAPHSV